MNVSATQTKGFLTFTEMLRQAAERRPAPAVWDETGWHTWADCLHQAERTASVLLKQGLRSGDVLAAWLPNSWELLVLHAATARVGILLLPLHSAYRSHEVGSLLTQAGAAALVTQDRHRGRDRVSDVLSVRSQCPSLRHVWFTSAGDDPWTPGLPSLTKLVEEAPDEPAELPPPRSPQAPLLLLASSGTTSRHPKLCLHTHQGLLGNAVAVAVDGDLTSADTAVSASPMSHAFGMLSVHLAMVTGGAVGLFPGWDAQRFLDALRTTSASVAFGVPAQLRDLVALARQRAGHVGVTLREVRTGGAPVSYELVRAVREVFGARVIVQWGMSEIGAGTYTRPDDPLEAVATIGRPASGARVRVVAADQTVLGPGETGELQYRSPHMFTGYFRAPDATRAAFTPDGWLRSGDLAELNPDGSVSYRGRADEVINRGGLKFSPLEVEDMLSDLPQLAQHAIVAQPDPRLGQRSCLVAVLRESARLTLEEVTGHLAKKGLATYKLPERMFIVEQLPTTVTGKVARGRLPAILQQMTDPVPRPRSSPAQPEGTR